MACFRLLALALALLPVASALADGGAAAPAPEDPVRIADPSFRLTSLLTRPPFLSLRADDDDPEYLPDEDEDIEGSGMDVSRKSEYEQGIYELRVGCYFWLADLDAVAQASNRGMRLAEALQYLSYFDTSIQHIDFVEELEPMLKNNPH